MQHLRTKVPRKLNPTLLEYDSVQSQMPTFSEDDPSLNTVTLHSSYGADSGIRRSSGFGLHSASYSTMQSSPMNSHTYSDDDILGQPVDDSINDAYVTHSDANLAYGLGEDLGVYSGMMDPRFPPLNLEFDDDEQQQQQTGLSAKLERIVESQSPSTISTPRYSSAMKQGPNFVSTMRQSSLIGVSKYDSPFGSSSSKNSSPFIPSPRPPMFNTTPRYVVPSPGLQSPGTLGPACAPRPTSVAVNMVRPGGVATTSAAAAAAAAAGVRLTRTELPTQVPARAQFARAGLPTQVLSTGYSNNTVAFNPSQPAAVRPCGRRGRGAARGGSTARNRSQVNTTNVSRLAEAQKDACDSLRNFGIIVHEMAGNELELEADEVLLEADGRRATAYHVNEDADLSDIKYETVPAVGTAASRPAHATTNPHARVKANRFANADELNDEDDETSEVQEEEEEEDLDDVLANGEDSDDDAYSPNRRAPSKRGRKTGTKRKKRMRHSAASKRARSTNPQWLGGAIKSETTDQFVRPFTRPFEARPNLKSVTKSRSSLPATRGSMTQSASIKHEACSSNSSASFANESNSVDEKEQKPGTSRWRSRSVENPEEDSTRAGAYQVDAGWRCVVCDRYAADIVGRKNYCAAPERYRLIYYGVPTCKGCQVFFRKTLMELKLKGHPYAALPCASGGGCTLLAGVGFCVACRFNRCVNNFPPPDALKPQRTPEGEVAKMVREKPVLHKVAADEKPGADEKMAVGGDDESRTNEPDAESYSSGFRRNGVIDGSSRHSRDAQHDDSNSADAEQHDDEGVETLELESVDDDSRIDTSADDCVVRIVEVAGDTRALKQHTGGSNQLAGGSVAPIGANCGLGARDGLV